MRDCPATRSGALPGMRRPMHYLLFYDFVDDYLERRTAHRSDHLRYAQSAVDRGQLLLGGALADPSDAGVLLFDVPSPEAVDAFARADPYVLAGVVSAWRVRPWTTVVGVPSLCPNPLSAGLENG
jgi:uncharacterized protein YciI